MKLRALRGRTSKFKGGKPKKPKTKDFDTAIKNWPKKIKDKELGK